MSKPEISVQTSYRWYRIGEVKGSIASASLRRRLQSWSSDVSWFALSEEESIDCQYRFFRRSEVLLEQYDSDGNQFYQRAESISSVGLSIVEQGNAIMLRLVNPGHNTRALLMAIEGAVGFGFWASPITLDLADIDSYFDDVDLKRVVGLKLADVVVAPGCIGRMEFASKHGLDLGSFNFLESMSFKRDYIKLELIHKGIRGHAAMSSSGLVRVSGDLAPFIRSSIERRIFNS